MKRSLRENLDFVGIVLLFFVLTLLLLAPFDWAFPLRIVFGLIFVLFAPGYASTAALFPGRRDVDKVERLTLSLGLSVVAVPLLGLAFNYTPWGIRLLPMTLGLFSFTTAALLIALYRRQRLPTTARFFPQNSGVLWTSLQPILLIGGFFSVAVMATQVLRPTEYGTEFYVLGPEGRLENYPTTLAPGQTFVLTFGVHNQEGRQQGYHIKLPFAGEDLVIVPRLEDGARWQRTLTLRAPERGGRKLLTFELYRTGDTEPYRSLRLFVTLGATLLPGPGLREPPKRRVRFRAAKSLERPPNEPTFRGPW